MYDVIMQITIKSEDVGGVLTIKVTDNNSGDDTLRMLKSFSLWIANRNWCSCQPNPL